MCNKGERKERKNTESRKGKENKDKHDFFRPRFKKRVSQPEEAV